ncbi:NYN domain-containing protein [Heliobacterium undosum]|uniref:NYN domain-containing protein n=1 Tax=Heliomicrobium undosum TaxID=121734 RepID=A0A845L3F4_9FIRM|nr:NYN domain-containing protein [Heliomicrobium undosum]MZP30236.1 NYN domain-containing protein [Heliomicrobium undosum]
MKDTLIVDGYNALNAWPDLHDLRARSFDHARDKLIDILMEYAALQGLRLIVVFDAHHVKGGKERVEERAGARIVYTREEETADRYIERLLGRQVRGNVWVATGDAVEQAIALGRGACRLPVRELHAQVRASTREKKQRLQAGAEGDALDSRLDSRLDEELRRRLEQMRRGLTS